MKTIYLAAGCFWGVEAFYKKINGIIETEVGYANGNGKPVTYDEVVIGTTGYAEICKITYAEKTVSLNYLLKKCWSIVDPISLNKQGNDCRTQYRSGIYYIDETDLPIILASLKIEQEKYQKTIVTEVLPLKNYFKAETYHQDYLQKNPGGYFHIKL